MQPLQNTHSASQCTSIFFDDNLRNCLSRILQCSLPDDSWNQATLPFHLGGLGLRSSYHSASAAFLAPVIAFVC